VEEHVTLRPLFVRFKRSGLQWRIMLYVTAGLLTLSATYGIIALQAVQQSTDLVYRERIFVARTLPPAIDDRWEHLSDSDRARTVEWLNAWLDSCAADYAVEVIDETGTIIASRFIRGRTTSLAHLQLIWPLWRPGQSGWRIHSLQIEGEASGHLIAFAPLGHMRWGVIVEEPVDEAFRLPRNLLGQFISYALLALGCGLILAWLTTRPVVRPSNALIHASRQLTQGNLD